MYMKHKKGSVIVFMTIVSASSTLLEFRLRIIRVIGFSIPFRARTDALSAVERRKRGRSLASMV